MSSPAGCVRCRRWIGKRGSKPIDSIFPPVLEHLAREIGARPPDTGRVCMPCLIMVRASYARQRLGRVGDMARLHADIARKAANYTAIAETVDREMARESLGTRVTDLAVRVGGSWLCFGSIALLTVVWLSVRLHGAQTPEVVLPCVAMLMASLALMGQNRIAARLARRDERDYRVGLKVETEVDGLHEKLDHLMEDQIARMTEIQSIHLGRLEEIDRRLREIEPRRRG